MEREGWIDAEWGTSELGRRVRFYKLTTAGRKQIRRPAITEQVAAEVEFHIEMRTRELVERGMNPAEARAEALRRFGNLDDVSAECRAIGSDRERTVRRAEFLGELRQDAAFAVRQLLKSPAFTAIAVVT